MLATLKEISEPLPSDTPATGSATTIEKRGAVSSRTKFEEVTTVVPLDTDDALDMVELKKLSRDDSDLETPVEDRD